MSTSVSGECATIANHGDSAPPDAAIAARSDIVLGDSSCNDISAEQVIIAERINIIVTMSVEDGVPLNEPSKHLDQKAHRSNMRLCIGSTAVSIA
jgi:hypothetical protein